jgi:hypothetical protein
MIIFDWSIPRMSVYPSLSGYTDVVYSISWVYTGYKNINNDENYTDITDISAFYVSSIGGEILINTTELGDFTPYNELTKEQVVGWIIPFLDVAALSAGLEFDLNSKANATVNLSPPW